MTDRDDEEAPLDDHAAEPRSDSGAACREPLTARGQARAGLTPPSPGNNRYPEEPDDAVCHLVTCRDLGRPHHVDTHAREDRAHATDCRDPRPSTSTDCWQCR